MRGRALLATAVLGGSALALVTLPGAALAAGGCLRGDRPGGTVTEVPWEARVLDPAAVRPHSTGAGVLVAVIDSGVDARHPQLRRKGTVGRGLDLTPDRGRGDLDCDSHGTAVASIIAAQPVAGVGFVGLAPGARILPVRVTERAAELDGSDAARSIDPKVIARAIRYAVDSGAAVINLSLSGTVDDARMRAAVQYARGRDVLVVAAAGNAAAEPGAASRPVYPAAYPGVLGVGAVTRFGNRSRTSQAGPHVDLVAPGEDVLAATRVRGHRYWSGTSFATPYVSAAAALVRAAWPQLTADQVAARLIATASPAPGGAGSSAYGAGLVNPYRAVTDRLAVAPAAPAPVVAPAAPDPVAQAAAARMAHDRGLALRGVGIGAALLALVGAAAGVGVRGRRGGWRAATAAPVPAVPSRPEPPEQMFLIPGPPAERRFSS